MQRLQPWALITGAALFICIFLVLRLYTPLSASIIVGFEFLILFFVRLIRALFGPIATEGLLRKVQIMRALPLGLYCLAAFFNAQPAASRYAPWVFLGGVILHLSVWRLYIRKLPHQAQ